jgi:hypothetical protein
LTDIDLLFRFGVALFIGILVGLQREYAFGGPEKEVFAGVRTFGLMGLIGCGAALVSDILASPWPFVAAVLVVGAFLAVTYYIDATRGGRWPDHRDRRCADGAGRRAGLLGFCFAGGGHGSHHGGLAVHQGRDARVRAKAEPGGYLRRPQIGSHQRHHPAPAAQPELRTGTFRHLQPLPRSGCWWSSSQVSISSATCWSN